MNPMTSPPKQSPALSNLIAGVLGGLVVLVIGAILIETDVIDTGDSTTNVIRQAPISQTATNPAASQDGKTVQQIYSQEGKGVVYVHVCKSKKKDSEGVICSEESIGRAKKKGGTYKFKAPFFDFPAFWLNSPGTDYWQAHRISCEGDLSDCRQEGPIVKFRVAG